MLFKIKVDVCSETHTKTYMHNFGMLNQAVHTVTAILSLQA